MSELIQVDSSHIKGEVGTGYEDGVGKGPFRCDNCEYFRILDSSCGQEDMKKKSKRSRTKDGRVKVEALGCCEYIDRGNPDTAQYGIKEKEMTEGNKKHHNFTHTHIDLHDDGSASIKHIHAEGPHKDVTHAVGDLDGIHDSLEEHLNPEEEDLEEKVHPGIHKIAEMMGGDEEKNEELVHPGIHHEIMKVAGKGE